jgi:hypothetical protein
MSPVRPFCCVLSCLVLATAASAQRVAPLPESARSGIGYPSPGAAYRALRADPAIQFRNQDGWVIADDRGHDAVWTFSPQGDPAFPAVVKRQVVERNGQLALDMSVLCGASKEVCDDFVRRFQRLDEAMARDIQRRAADRSAASAAH